jgi:nucleoside-diphosphate-sugar epimerase
MSPYGLQKLISEMECKLYSKLYGLDTVTLRYFNVYSPDQKAEGPYATAISNFKRYIKEGKRPFITGDGTQRRDMLNVKDAVSANIFAMKHKERFEGAVFDVGTGTNISLNEIRDIVKEYFSNVKFEYVEERKGDVLLTQAQTAPLKVLGWEASIGIEEGIRECYSLLAKNLNKEKQKLKPRARV